MKGGNKTKLRLPCQATSSPKKARQNGSSNRSGLDLHLDLYFPLRTGPWDFVSGVDSELKPHNAKVHLPQPRPGREPQRISGVERATGEQQKNGLMDEKWGNVLFKCPIQDYQSASFVVFSVFHSMTRLLQPLHLGPTCVVLYPCRRPARDAAQFHLVLPIAPGGP